MSRGKDTLTKSVELFIHDNKLFLTENDYNQINLWVSNDKIMFLDHQKVPNVATASSFSKEGDLC